MPANLIHDRGRGPEISGTRITVYHLLSDFLDPEATETSISRVYGLTPEQVAAARAYVLNNPDTVLAEHLAIEQRMAAGNPQEVIERAKQTHATFLKFKEWLDENRPSTIQDQTPEVGPVAVRLPTFREWLAEQESHSGAGA